MKKKLQDLQANLHRVQAGDSDATRTHLESLTELVLEQDKRIAALEKAVKELKGAGQ